MNIIKSNGNIIICEKDGVYIAKGRLPAIIACLAKNSISSKSSSQNLGSLYKGLEKDTFKTFKHLRQTKHTHNPVDDAKGNAEALLTMKREMGLKIKF